MPNPADTFDQPLRARVAALDWTKTPLGARRDWPQSLRTAVSICLNSKFPMFIWWGPGLINIYNDAYAPMLGKRHPAALARPGNEVWSEIWPTIGPQAEAVMRRGESTWNERVLLMMERQGFLEETYFTWSYSPIHDETGGVGGLFCACTEDTGRVLAERDRDREAEQRRAADERARTILESITDAFFSLDADWHFTYVNSQADRVLDRTPGDLLGKSIWDEYAGIIGTPFETLYRRAMSQRVAGSITSYYLDHRRWYEVHTYPASDGGLSIYFRNVTERQQTEAALRTSDERLTLAVESADLGTFHCPMPLGEIIWNDKCKEHFWLPADAAVDFDLFYRAMHPDDRDRTRAAVERAVFDRVPYDIEYRTLSPDGRVRWVRAKGRAYHGTDGQPMRFDGVTLDITDKKLLEQQRESLLEAEQAARAAAERASTLKDEFLATLSHELRTPLNAILGWSQIVKANHDDPREVADGIEIVERNARAQAQIIEDLLDMSRILSGKVRLNVQPLDVPAIVQAAIDTARPAAEAKGVRLEPVLDLPAGLAVRGDPNRLQQVLWNLLSNATKFTPKGGRVQVTLGRRDSRVEIVVSDSGEGIAPDFMPHVFDRFRQADATTTRHHGGLGLGLSIVKQLVELHGGSVRAGSDGLGRGASFGVLLPVAPDGAEAGPDATQLLPRERPSTVAGNDALHDIRGLRVLVADDEPDARALVQRLLQDRGALVTSAATAGEAFERLQSSGFDLLLSDVGMPGEDGYSLIRRVRGLAAARGGRTPAIALTAYARTEDRVKALDAGFQVHMAKPIEPAELIAAVARAAGRAAAES